jgi:hypothetical protein
MRIKAEWLTAAFAAIIAATVERSCTRRDNSAKRVMGLKSLLTFEREYQSEPLRSYRKVPAKKRLAGEDARKSLDFELLLPSETLR